MNPPRFIVLEGADGCGKSTQALLLARALRRSGRRVVRYREPGGTRIGEAVRRILLDARRREMAVATELLLYMAARAQGAAEVIGPALERGDTVVADRYLASSVVYQGFCQGLGGRWVSTLGRFATRGIAPGATLVLDLPVREAARRMGGKRDRMEAKGSRFQAGVRTAFLDLCRLRPRRFLRVDARGTEEEVHRRICGALGLARG
jgi:dTMP kinase